MVGIDVAISQCVWRVDFIMCFCTVADCRRNSSKQKCSLQRISGWVRIWAQSLDNQAMFLNGTLFPIGPTVLWSKIVHYVGNMAAFGTQGQHTPMGCRESWSLMCVCTTVVGENSSTSLGHSPPTHIIPFSTRHTQPVSQMAPYSLYRALLLTWPSFGLLSSTILLHSYNQAI
jgi:hypothetical protein